MGSRLIRELCYRNTKSTHNLSTAYQVPLLIRVVIDNCEQSVSITLPIEDHSKHPHEQPPSVENTERDVTENSCLPDTTRISSQDEAIVSSSPHRGIPGVREVSGLEGPRRVTINNRGNLLVTEWDGHCISELTMDGELVQRIPCTTSTVSSGTHQSNPCGIAIDAKDHIYVVINSLHQIQKLATNNAPLETVGEDVFCMPTGVCFNERTGSLYLCDHGNHQVHILSTDLNIQRTFGSHGNEDDQFQHPVDIAFDSANNLYVTDLYNHRVQVFTAEEEFLRSFTNKADGEKLENPFAITIDSLDRVYVSERNRHCVSVFTSEGEFVETFGSQGTEKGQFDCAYGLCVSQTDSVIVCDYKNNRLQIFDNLFI